MQCENCNREIKGTGLVLNDHGEDRYFCSESCLEAWLENYNDRAIELVMDCPVLVNQVSFG